MAYIVEPVLYEMSRPIVRGLTDGSLTRWGGVIRVAKGYPGAGQIASFLKELPVTESALQPANVTNQLLSVAKSVNQVNQGLAVVTQLSQVAAAASVLNLGVSVVGFAIMAHKLNRLQASVTQMAAALDAGIKDISARLDGIQNSLVELRYISLTSASMLEEALVSLTAIRSDLLADKAARVLAWMDRLHRDIPDDRLLRDGAQAFQEVRRWLSATIDNIAVSAERPPILADVMIRYRLWCMASVAEVATMRRAGDLEYSATLAKDAGLQARAWAGRWGSALASPNELDGVYRFGNSRFAESVPAEVLRRLSRLQSGNETIVAEQALRFDEGGRKVAYELPSLGSNWFEQQVAAAGVLDFVEETAERLETLGDEMDYCRRRRLTYDRWEALPLPTRHEGLACIQLD